MIKSRVDIFVSFFVMVIPVIVGNCRWNAAQEKQGT
jgi:hypothetical protein